MDQATTQMLAGLDGNILALQVTIFQYQTDLAIATKSSGDAQVDQQLMQEAINLRQSLKKFNHRLKGLMAAREELLASEPKAS